MKTEDNGPHEIFYSLTSQLKHELHIKVEGDHINEGPFAVNVKLTVWKFGTPMKTISTINRLYSVAINQRGETMVVENDRNCISIFGPARKKLLHHLIHKV